jgi:hypothetical protein
MRLLYYARMRMPPLKYRTGDWTKDAENSRFSEDPARCRASQEAFKVDFERSRTGNGPLTHDNLEKIVKQGNYFWPLFCRPAIPEHLRADTAFRRGDRNACSGRSIDRRMAQPQSRRRRMNGRRTKFEPCHLKGIAHRGVMTWSDRTARDDEDHRRQTARDEFFNPKDVFRAEKFENFSLFCFIHFIRAQVAANSRATAPCAKCNCILDAVRRRKKSSLRRRQRCGGASDELMNR